MKIPEDLTLDDLFNVAQHESYIVLCAAEFGITSEKHRQRLEIAEKRLCAVHRIAKEFLSYASSDFLKSYQWRKVRMDAIEKHGNKCHCCGRTPADGVKINVDHIVPRLHRPDLALKIENLQILCEDCNHGKGNRYKTNWIDV